MVLHNFDVFCFVKFYFWNFDYDFYALEEIIDKIIESRYIGISDIIGKSSILKNSNYRKIIESQYIDIFRNSDKIIDINNFDIGNLRELSANLLILKITEELSKIYLSYTPHIHF